ncbi:MAG: ATP-binding cassette domain-containing protein [Thiotrichaceae bacterium]
MSLLRVNNLSVKFGHDIKALDDISFEIKKNEILGIVGESGSGKSTLARSILKLQAASKGHIFWKNENINSFTKAQNKAYKKQIQMIFQDPLDALNPRMTVAQIISEPLLYLKPKLGKHKLSKQEITQLTQKIMVSMGLSVEQLNRYPHEFSGGQCQRIGIARAMIVEPELLVCDEPVSALDVSIQAQIINLLKDLRTDHQLSMMFISHDLSIVRHLCDRVLVLYKGKIAEMGETETIFQSPQSEYTQQLLASIPLHDPSEERQRVIAWGVSSSPQAR